MNLLNAPALLYLLTIPPVVLLYFLRLRRKDRVVSSTLLWENSTADLQANSPFQKLRWNLLLFLQILLLIVLALLVARPFLKLHAMTGESAVFVIDASASMQATDVGPSRIGAAKKLVSQMIGDLSRGDEACIVEAGQRTRVRAGFTSNQRTLSTALATVTATDTETSLRDALALAVSLAKKKSAAEIVLVSDGSFPPLDDLHLSGESLRFLQVGDEARNAGITAMDARRDYSSRGGVQVFVQITSYIDEPTEFVLEMYHEDSMIDARPIELEAKGVHGAVFSDFPYEAGVVTARIDLDDDLPADNAAFAHLQPRSSSSVRLVTEENMFLRRALEIDPLAEITRVVPADFTESDDFDVTIFDGWAPETLGDGSYLLIATGTSNAPVRVTGKVTLPAVVRWNDRHPVTQHASFDDVAIAEALSVVARPWGEVLVDGDMTPLIVAGRQGELRVVFVGFPFERSNLPLRAAFPILVQNCLEWLRSGSREVANRSIQTGEAVPLGDLGEGVTVRDPRERSHDVEASSGTGVFDATEWAGVYHVIREGEDESAFVANLLSPLESDLTPRSEISIGGRKVSGGEGGVVSNREIWRHLAVIALFILCLEWYACHRRI